MDAQRAARLQQKYDYAAKEAGVQRPPSRGVGPGGPRGPRGRFSGSKPHDTKKISKRLIAYFSKEYRYLVIALILILLQTGASLATSYMLRPIINTYIDPDKGNGDLNGLFMALVLMGVFYLTSVVSQYLMSRVMLRVSQRSLHHIRSDLFAKMQRLPVRFYDTTSNGEVMSRFVNDVDIIGEMLNHTLPALISGAITLVGTLFFMFYTNWILATISVVFIPVMLLILRVFTKWGRKYFRAQQAALGTLNGYIEETITGQKVVKVFCHEEAAKDEFEFLNRDLCKKQYMAQCIGSCMMPSMHSINNLTYIAVACVGVALCITRGFDFGGLTVFVNYARQFGRPINELSGQLNNIYSALAGAERVFEIIDSDPEPADKPGAVAMKTCGGTLEMKNVTFGYNEGKTILKDISFTVKRGQKVAFVGSTGAGKTTVTNLIPRFYDVWSGTITIDGTDIRDIKRNDLRSLVTLILQDTHLFTGTVRENIRYGRLDATDEDVVEAAKTANAHEFIMQLEHGYDTVLDRDGANLSQGQRQLLNIARAAISKSPILIMDEATSSVDTRTEKNIELGLGKLSAEKSTIMIAHRLSTVRDADCIMVMEQGEIIERGTHDELLKLGGRYYQLYTGLVELS